MKGQLEDGLREYLLASIYEYHQIDSQDHPQRLAALASETCPLTKKPMSRIWKLLGTSAAGSIDTYETEKTGLTKEGTEEATPLLRHHEALSFWLCLCKTPDYSRSFLTS